MYVEMNFMTYLISFFQHKTLFYTYQIYIIKVKSQYITYNKITYHTHTYIYNGSDRRRIIRMLHRVRQFIFDSSNLGEYVSILKQTKQEKGLRLLQDNSNPFTYTKKHQYNWKRGDQPPGFIQRVLIGDLPVLNPISHFMLYWYLAVFISVLYNYFEFAIVLVYNGAWSGELTTPVTLAFSWCTIFGLIVDMVVKLNSGYLKRGMIIMQRKRAIKNYLRGWFMLDISYIIILIVCLSTGSYNCNYGKFLCLTKVTRMSQIDNYFQRYFNVKRIKKTIYTILKLVVIIIVISHAIGVLFYVLDYYIYVNGIYQPTFCWIFNSTAYAPIVELSWAWQYFYSLYWGINTITNISYGDIQGANPTQVAYMLVCMLLGFAVYGYVVNQIIKIIVWARANTDNKRQQFLVMDKYMDNLQIPLPIKNQIRTHLDSLYRQQKYRNIELQTQMRDKLPQDLRFQLVSNAYSALNEKMVNIFQSTAATRFLFNLIEKKYTTDEQVVNQGDRAMVLNYLHKGKMEFIVVSGTQQFVVYQSESENQFLGHYQLFARKRWPFSIISKAVSTVYYISRESMFEQINTIDVLRQRFKEVQYEVIFKQNLQRIDHKCFFCQVSHDWKKCPSRFPHIKSSFHTLQNKRQNGIRIIRRKYRTLSDRDELKVLSSIKKMANKKLISIIEKRIQKIRFKLSEKSDLLQIDIAFDWKYYDINENFSRKKEFWNELVSKKINRKKQPNERGSPIKLIQED